VAEAVEVVVVASKVVLVHLQAATAELVELLMAVLAVMVELLLPTVITLWE
jgi:hypothetical protein